MMDIAARVERACVAMRGKAAWADRTAAHGMMANIDRAAVLDGLKAAFPELFSDPPTAWLAPMEADHAMQAEGRDYIREWLPRGEVAKPVTDQWQIARECFAKMRDAYSGKSA